MFEGSRACDGAVLGDVSDDYRRDAASLGDLDERGSHLADLRNPSRRSIGVGGVNGLHRVDDQHPWLHLVDVSEQSAQLGLSSQKQMGADRTDTLGTQLHLSRGLL